MPHSHRIFAWSTALLLTACQARALGPDGPLDGDPNDPVESAIPALVYEPQEGDDPTNTLVLSFGLGVTVGEANAVLSSVGAEIVGGVPGVTDQAEGLLVLHTPTEDADGMAAVVDALSGDPSIVAIAPDVPLVPNTATLPPQNDTPAQWTWTLPPTGSNWFLELTGVPQMWNFADATRKQGGPVNVTVIDVGFTPHPDLEFSAQPTKPYHEHGTAVAGVVAARWGDRIGIDGVAPYASIIPIEVVTVATLATQLPQIFDKGSPVVNISLGYGGNDFADAGDNPNFFTDHGKLFVTAMKAYESTGRSLPVVVVSAGQETFDIPHHARNSSPMTTAALDLGAANIIVVEGMAHAPELPEKAKRWLIGNYGAHLSAPAEEVMTLDDKEGYELSAGSSVAAPMVAATIAMMYAADPELARPTLDSNPAKSALLATALPVARNTGPYEEGDPIHGFLKDMPAAPRLNAFAALMDLDRVTESRRMLVNLCDIDDGSPDGNTRVDILTGAVVEGQDLDGDGGLGDGVVDMRDFRRLRDWLLLVEGKGTLDGSITHPKRDLNLDGLVQDPALEIFARADFNGDGRLDLDTKREVPGAIGKEATDLEVFMAAFEDPNVDASQLPGLLESGDIHVDLTRCFDRLDAARVEVRLGGVTRSVDVEGAGDPVLFTVAPGSHGVHVEAFDGAGASLSVRERNVTISQPGEDQLHQPECGAGGWLVQRIDAPGPQELNDKGQILAGMDPHVIVDPDGTKTPVDVGLPQQNHPHYLTEDGAFAVPEIGELVDGDDIYPTPTWVTISRNGRIAGFYEVGGKPRRAYRYDGGPGGGAPTHLLKSFTDDWGQFEMSDGQDFSTSNRHGINDAGTIVGQAAPYGEPKHAAILSGNVPDYLPEPPGAVSSLATLINNTGIMAGYALTPGLVPVVWEGDGVQVLDTSAIDNQVLPRMLGDDGTLIATCGIACHALRYPGSDAFEPFPPNHAVEEEDGSETEYRVIYIHDINADGVMLVSAVHANNTSPHAPRTTLLLTPQ